METDTHTDTHADTQNDYRNPRCACAPRVNECIKVLISNHATAHTKAGLKIILLTSTFVIYEVISKTEAHNLIMPKTTFFTEK